VVSPSVVRRVKGPITENVYDEYGLDQAHAHGRRTRGPTGQQKYYDVDLTSNMHV
jgi:hypothetical protein